MTFFPCFSLPAFFLFQYLTVFVNIKKGTCAHTQNRSNILLQHLVEYQLIGKVVRLEYSVREKNK